MTNEKLRSMTESGSEKILEPEFYLGDDTLHATAHRNATRIGHTAERDPIRPVLREPGHRRKARRFDGVDESPYIFRRNPDTDAGSEHIARQFGRALHRRRATGENNARAQTSSEAGR